MSEVALTTGGALYVVVVYALLAVLPGAVTWLKGQRLIFVVGLLFGGILWIVSAFRLARPSSWWSKRYYGGRKLERAVRRYGENG